MYSELQLIEKIRQMASVNTASVVRGIGDDCSVIRISGGLLQLVTTDTLVEGVHFNTSWHPPKLLGRKSASVNLSDIAAMAGVPRYAFLSLALSEICGSDWIEDFLSGFDEVLQEHCVSLLGGDTVRSPGPLMFSVTVMGEVMESEICYRYGARPGDLLLTSGTVGGAAAGLLICEKKMKIATEPSARLVTCHLDPQAKVRLGRLLGRSGKVHAMLDSSDGLASDIAHLCEESGVGAELVAESLPIAQGVKLLAEEVGDDPLNFCLRGGEDYQLVMAVPETEAAALIERCAADLDEKLTIIGRITEGHGVILLKNGERREITFQGYDHFKV